MGTMSQLWVGHATTNVARRHDSTKGPGATFAAWAHQGVTLVGPLERVSGRGLADGRCGPADGVSRKVALRHERRHRGARAPEPITAPGLIAPTRASLADRACAPLGGAPVAQCILVVVVLGLAVVGRGASKVLDLGETRSDESCCGGVHNLRGRQVCPGLLSGPCGTERRHRGARAPEPITAPGLIAPTRASLADRACAPLGGAPVAQCILVVVVLGLAVVGRGASKVLSLGETPRDDSCSAGVHKLGGQASCRSGGGRSRSRAPQACRGLLGGQRYPERQHSEQHTGHGAHTACEALSALRAGGPPQDRSP